MSNKIRFGIIGTGRIAHRMVSAILSCTENVSLNVYNPHIDSAIYFCDEMGIAENNAFNDLNGFISEIDVAYVATPHETHYEYSKKLLENGVHVLCEKPLCFEEDQASELFELAKTKKCILMEAVKTAYAPGFQAVLEIVESGKIGRIVDVEATFTRLYNSSVREIWNKDNGGSFVEFGTYTLLPIVKLLGMDVKHTNAFSLPAVSGVDSYTKVMFTYDDAVATAKTGLGVKSEGQLLIAGTNGYILVPAPWWLTKRVEVHFENAGKTEVLTYPYEGSGLQYELKAFLDSVNKMAESSDANWDDVVDSLSLRPSESIWFARQMENYRIQIFVNLESKYPVDFKPVKKPKVWAHRGCCMKYPENTLEAFYHAAELDGITGIELDIQLTKDNELVVIHDEKIDRTTNGSGSVRDYTLDELKQFCITGSGCSEVYVSDFMSDSKAQIPQTVPTMREALDLLAPYCREKGLMINIELKNSIIPYDGMERLILELVAEYGLENNIVYSSFNHASMGLIKQINTAAKTGILATGIEDCLLGAKTYNADALHPSVAGLDINGHVSISNPNGEKYIVRAWGGDEPFFGQTKKLKERHMDSYTALGVDEIITNVPEMYCLKKQTKY